MFFRAAIVDEGTTSYKLIKLDLHKKDNFLLYDSVELPTTTEILLESSKTSPTQKLKFKKFCSVMLKNTVLKLQERSPLRFVFVFLGSRNTGNNKADAMSMFTKVIDKLYENKH